MEVDFKPKNIQNPDAPEPAPGDGNTTASMIKMLLISVLNLALICGFVYKCNHKDKHEETTEQAQPAKAETPEQKAKREADEKRRDSLAEKIVEQKMEEIKSGAYRQSSSMSAAYNEGHDAGYNTGLEDGQYNRSRLASFNDYTSHEGAEAKDYQTGYREGYDTGYEDGRAEYEAQNSSR